MRCPIAPREMVPCRVLGVLLHGDSCGGVGFRRPSLRIVVEGLEGVGVVVLEVVELEAEETDVGDSGRFWVAPEADKTDVADSWGVQDWEGGRWLLGPVSTEGEGVGSGIR